MLIHQVTVAFLRKRLAWFGKLRDKKTGRLAGIVNFNIDFWLTMPPMLISVSLSNEQNVQLISAIALYCFTLVMLSLMIDGWKDSIVAPFWRKDGNPRKAFNKIENKRIADSIREINAKSSQESEKKTE
jgi:hypothetical protein